MVAKVFQAHLEKQLDNRFGVNSNKTINPIPH